MDAELSAGNGGARRVMSAKSDGLIRRFSSVKSLCRGRSVVAVRWICLVGVGRFVGVAHRCGRCGLLRRWWMRFMMSCLLMASTWGPKRLF